MSCVGFNLTHPATNWHWQRNFEFVFILALLNNEISNGDCDLLIITARRMCNIVTTNLLTLLKLMCNTFTYLSKNVCRELHRISDNISTFFHFNSIKMHKLLVLRCKRVTYKSCTLYKLVKICTILLNCARNSYVENTIYSIRNISHCTLNHLKLLILMVFLNKLTIFAEKMSQMWQMKNIFFSIKVFLNLSYFWTATYVSFVIKCTQAPVILEWLNVKGHRLFIHHLTFVS